SPSGAQGGPGAASPLGRIAAGDMDAFQFFYGRYAGRVLAYARQLSRHGDAAEDVTQEVFVAVWRRAASYRPERGDVTGWLYTITRNKLGGLWRRTGEANDFGGLDERPAGAAETGELPLPPPHAPPRRAPA